MASQRCVVWPTRGQEVRRLVSRHHLPSVGEDGGGEEAKGIHTLKKKKQELTFGEENARSTILALLTQKTDDAP